MHRILSFLLFLALSLPAQAQQQPEEGSNGMVVSAHPLASEAGLRILKAGGNAVDAAVATSFAIAVVEPYGSGLGGGGFAVLHTEGKNESLDFREMAPSSAHRDLFLKNGAVDPDLSRTGALSVGVPGLVQGLWDLHQKHGKLPWKDLLAPSVELARDGFPIHRLMRQLIEKEKHRFNPAALAVFAPGNMTPQVGQKLVQKDLSRTLFAIANEGPTPFYKGTIATQIAKAVQETGGLITVEDMTNYKTVWRAPIEGTYRGATVVSMPPPSSGGIHLMQMLKMLSHYDLGASGYGSSQTIHLLAESMKFAFADRSRWLGDSDFFPVPVDRLLEASYIQERRSRITADKAIPASDVKGAEFEDMESGNTTHLSVLDKDGNAVAATLTINLTFGSGMIAKGTGVVLNDEMDDFAAAPGVPNAFGLLGSEANAVAPGKRPLSSMTPTIVLKNGEVFLVVGSPGGSRIITTTLQTILHVMDFGMNIGKAISVPRFHHQWFPKEVYYEPYGLSRDSQRALEEKGHPLAEMERMGNAQGIHVDSNGTIYGASDPRGVGAARGY